MRLTEHIICIYSPAGYMGLSRMIRAFSFPYGQERGYEKRIASTQYFKTITFRVCATIGTVLIVFAFTGRLLLSLGVGAVETVVKLILYYVHERVWDKIRWGKPRHPLDLPQ